MPLQGHRPIHPLFYTQNAAAARAGMTATVRLSHPGALTTRNDTSGVTAPASPTVYYEGPARVQARGPGTPADAAGRQVTVGDYLLAVPVEAGDTRLDDLGQVLASPDDPLLVGKVLIVRQVPLASVVLQRNLGADLQTPTNP